MSVAEFLRTEDFIWRFEIINILFEGTVFLELASSVISKLSYTLTFVESLLAQTDLCLFCLSLGVCFRCSQKKKIRQLLYQNRKLQLELVKEKQKFSI